VLLTQANLDEAIVKAKKAGDEKLMAEQKVSKLEYQLSEVVPIPL
jgi:hypothetical protein